MALFQFVVHGVLEVDADDLGVAAANSLAGSDNPEGAGFEAGHAFRQNPAAGLELLLGASVLADLTSKLDVHGAHHTVHGFGVEVRQIRLSPDEP
jgi:hypothetical protein